MPTLAPTPAALFPDYLDRAAVAARLGIYLTSVVRLQRRGLLAGTRVHGKWLFPRAQVEMLATNYTGQPGRVRRPVTLL